MIRKTNLGGMLCLLLLIFGCNGATNTQEIAVGNNQAQFNGPPPQLSVLVEITTDNANELNSPQNDQALVQAYQTWGTPTVNKTFPNLNRIGQVRYNLEKVINQTRSRYFYKRIFQKNIHTKNLQSNLHRFYSLVFSGVNPSSFPQVKQALEASNNVSMVSMDFVSTIRFKIGAAQQNPQVWDETLDTFMNSADVNILKVDSFLSIAPYWTGFALKAVTIAGAKDILETLEQDNTNPNNSFNHDPNLASTHFQFPGRQPFPLTECNGTGTCSDESLVIYFDSALTDGQIAGILSSRGYTVKHKSVTDALYVSVPTSSSVTAELNWLKNQSNVWYAEPDYLMSLDAVTAPSDVTFDQQWYLENDGGTVMPGYSGTTNVDIDARNAWEYTKGSAATTIAVIDSGVSSGPLSGSIDHADFFAPGTSRLDLWSLGYSPTAGENADCENAYQYIFYNNNTWVNYDEMEPFCYDPLEEGVDSDDNGFADDVTGYFFVEDMSFTGDRACLIEDLSGELTYDGGHGTSVGSLIGAHHNNDADDSTWGGTDIAGVMDEVSLMDLQVFMYWPVDGSESCVYEGSPTRYFDLAFEYAINNGATIINASVQTGPYSEAVEELISLYDETALVVTSAGNDSSDIDTGIPHYPAGYASDNIVAVTAHTATNTLASFANYGSDSVDLAAPGENIWAGMPWALYQIKYSIYSSSWDSTPLWYTEGWHLIRSGTSFATAITTGVAGLLVSDDPSYTVAQLKDCLLSSTTPLSGTPGATVTDGRLDAYAALYFCREYYSELDPGVPAEEGCNEAEISRDYTTQSSCESAGYSWIPSLGQCKCECYDEYLTYYDGDEWTCESAGFYYNSGTGDCTCYESISSAADEKGGFGCSLQAESTRPDAKLGLAFLALLAMLLVPLRLSKTS